MHEQSWHTVHTIVEVAETINALCDPPAVILLPTPLFPLTSPK